jgi:hypothetical protein
MKIIKNENRLRVKDWSNITYPALITYDDDEAIIFALGYDEIGRLFKGYLLSDSKTIRFPDYSNEWVVTGAKLYIGTITLSND